MDFVGFPKIPRLSREIIVTEKIDGTNAQIYISDDRSPITLKSSRVVPFLCGSKSRYVFPENDNQGFAKWAYSNVDSILELLGPGRHFGEWWGQGINRGYGLREKRFSLFNVTRWAEQPLPPGVFVVPVMLTYPEFDTYVIQSCLERLITHGSLAAFGYMNPEGVVIYHTQGNVLFKKTILKDELPKGGRQNV